MRSVVPAPHRAMVDPKAPGTVQDKSAARAGGRANQDHRALLGAGMVDKVWLFNGAVRAAVTAVGNVAADVERHLKPAGNANADRAALREAFEGQKRVRKGRAHPGSRLPEPKMRPGSRLDERPHSPERRARGPYEDCRALR